MFSYFFHRIKKPVRISLVMVVKNEEDIIADNINFHSKIGVDNFVIIDNGSNDKTYDIIHSLSSNYEITLLKKTGVFNQKKMTTEITKLAFKKYNPDWIINSDADEFWVPQQGSSLKEVLNFKGGVLKVPRSNMILYQGLNRWKESEYRVANQIFYRENLEGGNIILGTIGRKVIVNPHGYIKTNSGNHSAEHIAFWRKREFSKIHIYHYPIRSYQQFERSIINRVKLLKIGAKMGSHYKKWAKLYEEGKLKEEFEKMVFDGDKIQCLEEVNILKKDTTPKSLFKQFGLL